jgi:prepilin-type N-terminal cleavage/methylation domain-containing protein
MHRKGRRKVNKELRNSPEINRQRQKGVTLIETVVVCVLVAVVSSIVIPPINETMRLYQLTASANLVASELNAARALAISRNGIYRADVIVNGDTIQIIDPDNALNNPRIEQSLESGITFTSTVSSITFYPRGYADAGTLELQNEDAKTISIQVLGSGKIKIGDMG